MTDSGTQTIPRVNHANVRSKTITMVQTALLVAVTLVMGTTPLGTIRTPFLSASIVTVPVAIEAFLESEDFEDAIRTAISVGGDSDTVAAITGSIAEAYYGVPKRLSEKARTYLSSDLLQVLNRFEEKYKP